MRKSGSLKSVAVDGNPSLPKLLGKRDGAPLHVIPPTCPAPPPQLSPGVYQRGIEGHRNQRPLGGPHSIPQQRRPGPVSQGGHPTQLGPAHCRHLQGQSHMPSLLHALQT